MHGDSCLLSFADDGICCNNNNNNNKKIRKPSNLTCSVLKCTREIVNPDAWQSTGFKPQSHWERGFKIAGLGNPVLLESPPLPSIAAAMDTVRLRLVLDNALNTTTEGLRKCWILLKPQHKTISDLSSHIFHVFDLHNACPHGLLLSVSI